jgi:aquaporin Z
MPETTLPPPDRSELVDTAPAVRTDGGIGGNGSPLRNVGSEFFGTVLLMLAGPGLIVLGAGRVDTLAVALSFGAALAISIGVIGAVANPAFSLALMIVREISPREAVEDWIGQLLGGVVGAALIWGINDTTRVAIGANGWDRGGLSELGSVVAAELVFTIVVIVVFLSAISQGLSRSAIAAFTGLASAVAHLVTLGISGGGLNPARSFGSAIFSDGDPNPFGQVIVFIVVPMIAAVAAVFIWLAIDDADVDDTMFDETIVDSAQNLLTGDTVD